MDIFEMRPWAWETLFDFRGLAGGCHWSRLVRQVGWGWAGKDRHSFTSCDPEVEEGQRTVDSGQGTSTSINQGELRLDRGTRVICSYKSCTLFLSVNEVMALWALWVMPSQGC